MATQRLKIAASTDLVEALGLTAGKKYSIQVVSSGGVSYSESADTEAEMPEARHALQPLKMYTVEVAANTKIWVSPFSGEETVIVTEGL